MKLDRYFTWDIYRGNEKDEEFSTRVEVGHTEEELFLLAQSKNRKKTMMDGFQTEYDRVIQFGTQSPETVKSIEDAIAQDIETPSGTSITGYLNDVEGTYKGDVTDGTEEVLDRIELEINEKGLYIHAFNDDEYLGHIIVPSREEMKDGELSGENELDKLASIVESVRSSYKENRIDSPYAFSEDDLDPLIEDSVMDSISDKKYGHEVIGHIEDGDACLKMEILQPALASYIHAIEWAAIAYLESEEGEDIIEKENDGQLYYFAKGGNNVLDELQNYVEIDQKTISKIESMNRAERRWMAHHKSGETLPDEVKAVRARLGAFLTTLF